ncbi:hypothetical protein BD410DRAFT_106618 [Rickenella mellea]|uniref:Uncharacterized protein n=1 Tax=Rickenella mellea TaxID=50990 RepID=A0A4Y7PKC2_9AGAM|nr:hypothetical protein BD410DRAFT_106618 [Rickenella mellea]
MPVTLSTSFEHSSSPRSLPILTNPARQLRKVPTAFTERFALPAPGTAPKSNRHITYANVVNSQSRKVEPLEHRWPDPTSNFQRKRSVTGHVYASEGPSSSLLQEVTGKNLSMVSTDYRQESCHNGRGLEFATAWSFDASPVQSVSAEITDEWQVWWQENTREMAAFLDRHRDRDINVERQKECVTLARSAQIYQRLVVYFYLEMHVFGPHGTMDFLHETLMKWAEWDELQCKFLQSPGHSQI